MKKCITFTGLILFISSVALVASAHVVVKPNSVGIGSFQTFSIGVPVEKDIATIGIRLVLPSGLEHVTPNVKPGWRISVQEKLVGVEIGEKVTEIVWSGGIIPAGQRDDFLFSAKVPNASTTLAWKAYQTYADGSVVAWDQSPAEKRTDFSKLGPYSETKVVDDLTPVVEEKESQSPALTFSIVALAFSIVALFAAKKNNQPQ